LRNVSIAYRLIGVAAAESGYLDTYRGTTINEEEQLRLKLSLINAEVAELAAKQLPSGSCS
jgi:hypothetical protein